VSRVAIIGSCITRDLWPARDENPPELLYISRSSLPSLVSPPVAAAVRSEPPPGLTPFEHRAVVWDLHKQALPALIAYAPTHIVFDFIDERYDLLAVGDALANHSWELQTSGYLTQPPLNRARSIARASEACDALWRSALDALLALIRSTPSLNSARLILHRAQWAERYRALDGEVRTFAPEAHLLEGRLVQIQDQNALLERYHEAFAAAAEGLVEVSADPGSRVGSAAHRWGLSPFHFVPEYYDEVRGQLERLGVTFTRQDASVA
jgi:hypothetical protein